MMYGPAERLLFSSTVVQRVASTACRSSQSLVALRPTCKPNCTYLLPLPLTHLHPIQLVLVAPLCARVLAANEAGAGKAVDERVVYIPMRGSVDV